MHVKKIRSSSINSYKFCPFQYFLNYYLDIESKSGKAALQGTIVHSVLEWLALMRKLNKPIVPYKKLLEKSWEYHTKRNPHIEIRRTTSRGDAADYIKCLSSIEKVINSIFNPLKLNIIESEFNFNITLPNHIFPDGKILSGTIDLIHKIDDETIEILDWKTGKQKDWTTHKDKDFYDLMRDVQPRIYHLAAFLLYPQYKNIIATFNYMNDKGATTLPFTIEDIPYTIAAIKRFIDRIESDKQILRNRSWKCSKFCFYGRSGICKQVWDDRNKYGTKYVEKKYYKININDVSGDNSDV